VSKIEWAEKYAIQNIARSAMIVWSESLGRSKCDYLPNALYIAFPNRELSTDPKERKRNVWPQELNLGHKGLTGSWLTRKR